MNNELLIFVEMLREDDGGQGEGRGRGGGSRKVELRWVGVPETAILGCRLVFQLVWRLMVGGTINYGTCS